MSGTVQDPIRSRKYALTGPLVSCPQPSKPSQLWLGRGIRAALTGAIVLALSGCKGGDTSSSYPIISGGSGALASYFVPSFQPFEAAASNLRNTVARYTIQANDWWLTSTPAQVFSSYPLASSRAEYAHAVGLTGAGQIISIIDEGFLTTHEALANKSISISGSISPFDHGTAVASVAAGNSASMIGIAPGANLTLGNFSSPAALAAATNKARQVGAVAQNNSWGYSMAANQANFNSVFGTTSGANYLSALDAYAARGVVVFAVANNSALTASELMDALPALRPSLEPGWLAVGNAVPVFNNSAVQSAQMVSAGCLDAARWCLVADGSWVAATAVSTTDYAFTTGSSFAAPQVAGALALLAQAFPALSPHDLRIRLLASADNGFFAPDGTVQLTPGFAHAYSNTFGHGFLDIRAALLPIGVTSMSTATGATVSVQRPLIVASAAMGDAVTHSLQAVEVSVADSLNAPFRMPGTALAAAAAPQPLAANLLSRSLVSNLETRRTVSTAALSDPFASFAGQTMGVTSPEGDLTATLLLPTTGNGADNYGVNLTRSLIDSGNTRVDVGVKLARDEGGAIGFGSVDGGGPGAELVALQLGVSHELGNGGFFALSGEMGHANLGATSIVSNVSAVSFNSFGVDLGQRGVFSSGDRLSLGVSMPMAVTAGRAEMVLPLTRANGHTSLEPVSLDLAPSDRQVDLSISYQKPLVPGLEMLVEVVHATNYGNRAGISDTAGVVALTFKF